MFLFLTHNRAPGALPNVVARQGAKHAERKHAGKHGWHGILLTWTKQTYGQNIHVTFICEGLHSQSSRRYRVGTPAECLEQVCLLFGPALYISRPRPLQPQSPRGQSPDRCHDLPHPFARVHVVVMRWVLLHVPSPLSPHVPCLCGFDQTYIGYCQRFFARSNTTRPTCRPRH